MKRLKKADGKYILVALVSGIQKNKEYLSEIDGLIGDGDHGVNMNKGFTVFQERCLGEDISFVQGLEELSSILFNEIGGSMGPIYGTIFSGMADAGRGYKELGIHEFYKMLENGYKELTEIIEAQPGDKTIVDAYYPAVKALYESECAGEDFQTALEKMKTAAEEGKERTKEMKAKFGRSSRLGDRSIGVLDAGAASWCILLESMTDAIIGLLKEEGKK